MSFPLTAFRPQPSAVEHDNRVTSRLNRAGTEQLNPLIGSSRDAIDSGTEPIGIALNLEFFLNDPLEQVYGTDATVLDDAGNVIITVDIRDLWSLDTVALKATAKIIIGQDIPADDASRRVVITVWTSRKRALSAQYWIRNLPEDAVLLNGVKTSVSQPIVILVSSFPAQTPSLISVNFFPSWNDEVGRQHSTSPSFRSTVVKPYGGAETVEVIGPGSVARAESPVQDVTTHSFLPSSSGQSIQIEYRFRSKAGSTDFVRAFAYVRFDECDTGGAPSSSSSTGTAPTVPGGASPQVENLTMDDISTFPPGAGMTGDGQVMVELTTIGVQEDGDPPPAVTLRVNGFKAGVADDPDNPGSPLAVANIFVATQDEIVTVPGIYAIDLDPALAEATLVTVQAFATTIANIGNSLTYVAEGLADIGFPNPPAVTTVGYNFSTGLLSYDVVSFGFDGETDILVRVQPARGFIAEGGGDAQVLADLAADLDGVEETKIEASLGPQTFQTVFAGIEVSGVIVIFENNVGAQKAITFLDDGTPPYVGVKKNPVATFSLDTVSITNDAVEIVLSDSGFNPAGMPVHYSIVDVATGGVVVDALAQVNVPNFPVTFTSLLQTGHDDIDGIYHFWIEADQGFSAAVQVDNRGGANNLPA